MHEETRGQLLKRMAGRKKWCAVLFLGQHAGRVQIWSVEEDKGPGISAAGYSAEICSSLKRGTQRFCAASTAGQSG